MKRKTAILLVGAFALSAVLSGCGGNKKATEAANESVESEDPEGKAKNSDDAEEEEKKEEEREKTKSLTCTGQAQHFFGGPSVAATLPQAVTHHPP